MSHNQIAAQAKDTAKKIEKTKQYAVADGAAYNVMYGFGEQYVTPYAIKLGASDSTIGILSSVPNAISAFFQIIGAKLTEKYQNRKKIVLWGAIIQAAMILPLFIVPFLTQSMLLLTVIFTIYLAGASLSGPAWSAWIGDVVSESERSTYFSRRNKIMVATLLIAVVLAGLILNYFSQVNIWVGFGILFSIAFIGKVASVILLSKHYEPPIKKQVTKPYLFKEFTRDLWTTDFGGFVVFRSILAFMVMIGSPFFTVLMLKHLGFSYIQFMIIVIVPMLIKIVTVTYWGKYADRFGTKRIIAICAILVALIPISWFIVAYFHLSAWTAFIIFIITEAIGGFGWGGLDLAAFNYILETTPIEKRARSFGYFNFVFGIMVMLGGLCGALLVKIIATDPKRAVFALAVVFAISAIGRLLAGLYLTKRMSERRIKRQVNEHKLFFELVISRPLHTIGNTTTLTLIRTQKDLRTIQQQLRRQANSALKKVSKTISAPLVPIVKGTVKTVDLGLEQLEPLRQGITNTPLAKEKKKMRKALIYEDIFVKQINTHTPKKDLKSRGKGKTYKRQV